MKKMFKIEVISRNDEYSWISHIIPADAIKSAADFETECRKAFKASGFENAEIVFYVESSASVTGWRRIRKVYF